MRRLFFCCLNKAEKHCNCSWRNGNTEAQRDWYFIAKKRCEKNLGSKTQNYSPGSLGYMLFIPASVQPMVKFSEWIWLLVFLTRLYYSFIDYNILSQKQRQTPFHLISEITVFVSCFFLPLFYLCRERILKFVFTSDLQLFQLNIKHYILEEKNKTNEKRNWEELK